MTLIIAGYTAAPTDKRDAAIYYEQLFAVPRVGGLELGWNGTNTRTDIQADIADLLNSVPAEWVFTLSAIRSTYQSWVKDHRFGLASADEDGRLAAVDMARGIADAIKAINDNAGRRVVTAVELHAAPGFNDRTFNPNPHAFARSLRQVADFDWNGTAVLVEHCDAFVPNQIPAKGFLSLEQEIDVLKTLAGSPIGLSLNWGRSLIELRDPDRVADQVEQASASGLLKAFTFSGTAEIDNPVGRAWADSHLPFADPVDGRYGEPASLLTVARAQESLQELDDLLFLAVKTNWPANRTDPVERAASVITNFNTVVDLIDRTKNPIRRIG
jgi:hypothetical protein